MKGPEFDIEKIEAYLLNRLEPEEKTAFEKAMNQDPVLAQEVTIQKDAIQAIQQVRKAELKARLNAIEINNGIWSHTGKIAATILLLFSLGAGTYLLIPRSSDAITEESPVITGNADDMEESVIEPVAEPHAEPVSVPSVNPAKAPDEIKAVDKTAPTVRQPIAEVRVPELNDSFDFGEDLDKQVSLPNPDIARVVDTKAKLNIDLIDQEGAIRYKYYNNKLFLYGKFNAEPYEILELNASTGKDLYLYFKGAFYKLNSDTFDVSLLEPISDPDLKLQLEQLRSK